MSGFFWQHGYCREQVLSISGKSLDTCRNLAEWHGGRAKVKARLVVFAARAHRYWIVLLTLVHLVLILDGHLFEELPIYHYVAVI